MVISSGRRLLSNYITGIKSERLLVKSDSETYRYERKFHVSDTSMQEIEALLRLHPANFSKQYPDRVVNNVYYDSLGFNSFNDNIEGLPDRRKFRIRWYGKTLGYIANPVLEIKDKQNLLGGKQAFSLETFTLDKQLDFKNINRVIRNSTLPPKLAQTISSMKPILLNSYSRRYYISFDKRFRVTVDDSFSYRAIRSRNNSYLGIYPDPYAVVIELKYNLEAAADAEAISTSLNVRMTKNSKYVNGIYSAYG